MRHGKRQEGWSTPRAAGTALCSASDACRGDSDFRMEPAVSSRENGLPVVCQGLSSLAHHSQSSTMRSIGNDNPRAALRATRGLECLRVAGGRTSPAAGGAPEVLEVALPGASGFAPVAPFAPAVRPARGSLGPARAGPAVFLPARRVRRASRRRRTLRDGCPPRVAAGRIQKVHAARTAARSPPSIVPSSLTSPARPERPQFENITARSSSSASAIARE